MSRRSPPAALGLIIKPRKTIILSQRKKHGVCLQSAVNACKEWTKRREWTKPTAESSVVGAGVVPAAALHTMLKRMMRSKHFASKELLTQQENKKRDNVAQLAQDNVAQLACLANPSCSNVSGPFVIRAVIFTHSCCWMHQVSRNSPASEK